MYVQVSVNAPSGSNYFEFYIDDEYFGLIGGGATGRSIYDNPSYIIPTGSTYELRKNGTASLNAWHEARMPLAIAVGGASGGGDAQPPVAFNLSLSSDQAVNSGEEATVKFDTALIDTENAFDNTAKFLCCQKRGNLSIKL